MGKVQIQSEMTNTVMKDWKKQNILLSWKQIVFEKEKGLRSSRWGILKSLFIGEDKTNLVLKHLKEMN